MSVNVSMRAFDPTTPIGEVYAFIKQNMDAVYYTTLPGSDAPVEGIQAAGRRCAHPSNLGAELMPGDDWFEIHGMVVGYFVGSEPVASFDPDIELDVLVVLDEGEKEGLWLRWIGNDIEHLGGEGHDDSTFSIGSEVKFTTSNTEQEHYMGLLSGPNYRDKKE
jgi:hypothetical protein